MRKHLLYNLRPRILASRIDLQIFVCQSRFLDLFFLLKKIMFNFGTPIQNLMGSTMVPKSSKWRQKLENFRCSYAHNAVFFQTLFPRNHNNPRAVGTSLKGHFFYVDWLANFQFLLRFFVLCFIQHFWYVFHKT